MSVASFCTTEVKFLLRYVQTGYAIDFIRKGIIFLEKVTKKDALPSLPLSHQVPRCDGCHDGTHNFSKHANRHPHFLGRIL